jgi:hypothetical protein
VGRAVKVMFQGRMVDGEELAFETVNESWNEYACHDGSTVRVKVVVAKITRLLHEKNEDGEPVYIAKVSSIISATPPPGNS